MCSSGGVGGIIWSIGGLYQKLVVLPKRWEVVVRKGPIFEGGYEGIVGV